MKTFRCAAMILACGLLGACSDLAIDDPNRPNIDEALGSAVNLERSVQGAISYWMGGVVLGESVNFPAPIREATFVPALEELNDAMTFGRRNPALPASTVADEPRTEIDHHAIDWTVNK